MEEFLKCVQDCEQKCTPPVKTKTMPWSLTLTLSMVWVGLVVLTWNLGVCSS
jgi:hypothetical protein